MKNGSDKLSTVKEDKVRRLMKKTGQSYLDCLYALEQSGWAEDKAFDYIAHKMVRMR